MLNDMLDRMAYWVSKYPGVSVIILAVISITISLLIAAWTFSFISIGK